MENGKERRHFIGSFFIGPSDGAYARARGRANDKSIRGLAEMMDLDVPATANIKSSFEGPVRE
jgi:hypothetical protein